MAKFLIIDDAQYMRLVLKYILAKLGNEVMVKQLIAIRQYNYSKR